MRTLVRDFAKFERRSGTTGPRGPAGGSASKSALNFSGVWRFRDLLPFYEDESQIVTIGEGGSRVVFIEVFIDVGRDAHEAWVESCNEVVQHLRGHCLMDCSFFTK